MDRYLIVVIFILSILSFLVFGFMIYGMFIEINICPDGFLTTSLIITNSLLLLNIIKTILFRIFCQKLSTSNISLGPEDDDDY